MKDTLILEHKIYISAKRAVILSGYKNDYIGQLCRENKLDSKMIGRTWFVTEESLLNHRASLKNENSPIEAKLITKINQGSTIGDSIILDRKNYVSAKRAAEISGYTSDYVGQLCRAGKLESTRVGKAWFVSEKSILSHCITSAQESASQAPVIIEKKNNTEKIIIPVKKLSNNHSNNISDGINNLSNKINNNLNILNTKNSSVISINYFTKMSIAFAVAIVLIVSLFQSSFLPSAQVTNSSASVVSSSLDFGHKVISFFMALPRFAFNLFSNKSDYDLTVSNTIDKPPPIIEEGFPNGLVVIPSSGQIDRDELIKQKIKSSFSDEVEVSPDKSGTAGIITPVFKKTKGDSFVYVLVPMKNQ